jgi:glycosyltransferase involved in cell wall biosynthesis
MATYNRSNIIGYAIETVRRQTFTDWELLIVGDACTDDTAAVVAAFADPRIRFWSLPQNHGEQSGPNNAGMAEARGRYVAMLNHDDFWMPGHLARAVALLESDASLDLVYGLMVAIHPNGGYRLHGPSPSGSYEPQTEVPASAWVFRQPLLARVGGWRFAREQYDIPSQDWLTRVVKAGGRTRVIPRLSVVALQSGGRARSYADRAEAEHAAWFARISGPADWEPALLCDVMCSLDLQSYAAASTLAVRPFLTRAAKNLARQVLVFGGIRPASAMLWLKYRKRGAFVEHLRRVRGLDPLR